MEDVSSNETEVELSRLVYFVRREKEVRREILTDVKTVTDILKGLKRRETLYCF